MDTLIARITAAFEAARDKINTLPRSKPFTVGDGAATEFTLTHNLGTMDFIASCRLVASPYTHVIPDYYPIDDNNAKVEFGVAPTEDQYRITFVGAKP